VHAQNGHIFISGLKSDITIMFLHPKSQFPKRCENFGDSCTFMTDIASI